MARIIEINRDLVTIELDDQTTKKFPKSELNCTLNVGQEVDVFYNGEVVIVKDSRSEEAGPSEEKARQHFKTYNYTFGIPHARIKKWQYILLCLIGFTGIQRMLTNRLFSGIFCLVAAISGILSFIAIFIWIYDLVNAILKPSDRDGYIYV